jgi:hypothetical protein
MKPIVSSAQANSQPNAATAPAHPPNPETASSSSSQRASKEILLIAVNRPLKVPEPDDVP